MQSKVLICNIAGVPSNGGWSISHVASISSSKNIFLNLLIQTNREHFLFDFPKCNANLIIRNPNWLIG